MTEFYGDTLEEALGKALGTPDEFGRRIRQGQFGGEESPSPYPFDDPQRIESARRAALARARAFADQADHTARTEDGIMFLYDKQTGLPITVRPSTSSFHHVGFNLAPYKDDFDRYVMLAHTHTHVRSKSGDPHTRDNENNSNRGWSTDDQNYLLDFAPGFLLNPFGDVVSGGEPPYRPLSEHPQLK